MSSRISNIDPSNERVLEWLRQADDENLMEEIENFPNLNEMYDWLVGNEASALGKTSAETYWKAPVLQESSSACSTKFPKPPIPVGDVLGVDVSRFQQDLVDWSNIKRLGFKWAYVEITHGEEPIDEKYTRHNWDGMKDACLLRGAYHFLTPGSFNKSGKWQRGDPSAQAEVFVRTMRKIGAVDAHGQWTEGVLAPIVDVEWTSSGSDNWDKVKDVNDRRQFLAEWLVMVRDELGRAPIVYTNYYFWYQKMQKKHDGDATVPNVDWVDSSGRSIQLNFEDYPLLISYYEKKDLGQGFPPVPFAWQRTGWTFWQYRGNVRCVADAKADGLYADLNVFNGTLEQLQALTGLAGPMVCAKSSAGAVEEYIETEDAPPTIYDGSTPAPGTILINASRPVDAPVKGDLTSRTREIYDNVINQFAVEKNPRYSARDTDGDGDLDTLCNIFVWDVTRAMGTELPHWVDAKTSAPTGVSAHSFELNPEGVLTWLHDHGADYGWRPVSDTEAQELANKGHATVAVAREHMAIVRPGEININGPATAQAGKHNFNQKHMRNGFGTIRPEYWVNDTGVAAKPFVPSGRRLLELPSEDSTERYGGYDLQRDDRDDMPRYAGGIRSAKAGDKLPAAGTTPYVQQLQQDLTELGFRVVGTADGLFSRTVEWAVREFQIYAQMKFVAREAPAGAKSSSRYLDRLSQVANTAPYSGPISGVVNTDTRSLIGQWLVNRWRCPVVIEAWNMSGNTRSSLHAENIWLHDEVTSTRPRMFVRDFSDYYSFPATHSASDLQVIGDHATYSRWDGPRSQPPTHTWSEGELLPEDLIGTSLPRLTATERSTYKVTRAVSEVECIGFFDCLNAYDNAFISLGPCHWTLGIADSAGAVGRGELCAYLAYLQYADAAAFDKAFGVFGARISQSWVDGATTSGRRLFDRSLRAYSGLIALQQESGGYARLHTREDEWNYFKTWHWFYRFVMAGRTIEGFRRRMWHMARLRIRDISSTPWGTGFAAIPDGSGGTRPVTIGDVYTSERAMALILRWHIRFPANIVTGGNAGTRLRAAFRRAGVATTDPSTWTDVQEAALIQGLRDEATALHNADLIRSIDAVDSWPSWAGGANPRGYRLDRAIGNLAVTRASFQFDDSDLPPPPY